MDRSAVEGNISSDGLAVQALKLFDAVLYPLDVLAEIGKRIPWGRFFPGGPRGLIIGLYLFVLCFQRGKLAFQLFECFGVVA